MASGDALIEHLLRRAGFGASSDELAAYSRPVVYAGRRPPRELRVGSGHGGRQARASRAYLGTTSQGPFSPNTLISDARQRWLFRMVHTERPLQEKMGLFWHNYFATALLEGRGIGAGAATAPRLMNAPDRSVPHATRPATSANLLLAVAQGSGDADLARRRHQHKAKPQENFGRELMELFSRGVGFYTEDDVYAAARVFTGWNLKPAVRPDRRQRRVQLRLQREPARDHRQDLQLSRSIRTAARRFRRARRRPACRTASISLPRLPRIPKRRPRLVTKLYAFFVSETVRPIRASSRSLATTYLQNDTVHQAGDTSSS